jgi:pyridoxal phosphate enzyme (YggS family)
VGEPSLADRLAAVDAAIADAAQQAGRSPRDITRIVVTKFHPVSLVRELAQLGVRDVGENRHQEASEKVDQLGELDLNWHFIGQLQSNKAKAVRRYAHAIHSVDRPSLVTALAAETVDSAALDVFIELDLSSTPGRGGVSLSQLLPLAEQVLETSGLLLRGLMAVAPLGEDPQSAFARVRDASERLLTVAPAATALSIGMSGDFRDAIQAGATHLRIGTAITGKRPTAG